MQSARFFTSKLAKLNKQDHVEAINTIVGERSVVEGHFQIADSSRIDGTFAEKSRLLVPDRQHSGRGRCRFDPGKDAVIDGCAKALWMPRTP